MIFSNTTPAKIALDLYENWPSAGLISDEAGSLFRGGAMKDLGMLNQLWDGTCWIIQNDESRFSTKDNASGRKIMDDKNRWVLDKIKPYIEYDRSYIADGIIKSYLAEPIVKSFPMHIFNPYVDLYFRHLNDKLMGQIDLYNYLFKNYRNDELLKTVVETLNDFINGIRIEGKSKQFKLILSNYKRLQQKNYKSLLEYIEKLLKLYASLLVIRIDLSYGKEKFDHPVNGNDRNKMYFQANADRELFLKEMRSNPHFEHLVGYVWKLEYGLNKGFHYHMLFFFDGSQVREDINIAKMIGE